MQLDGTKSDLKLIELVVNEMMLTINNKGFVEPEEIRMYLESLTNGELVPINGNGDEPVVLYTHKGSVRARTAGQKEYLDVVKDNDIVFAIGPAGTGKTYQAVAMAVSALKSKAVDRIIITRPAVEAGVRLGFLPGDLKD
jgi:phosphate starvation-inducible PhoH-like protein